MKKLEKSSLWLTRIFLSIFHFSVIPSNQKNAKMEYTCGHFLFFDFSAFNQKRKNRKLTPGPLNFLFFPFLDKNRNCRSYHVVDIYRCQTWIMTLYVIRSTISPNASLQPLDIFALISHLLLCVFSLAFWQASWCN